MTIAEEPNMERRATVCEKRNTVLFFLFLFSPQNNDPARAAALQQSWMENAETSVTHTRSTVSVCHSFEVLLFSSVRVQALQSGASRSEEFRVAQRYMNSSKPNKTRNTVRNLSPTEKIIFTSGDIHLLRPNTFDDQLCPDRTLGR